MTNPDSKTGWKCEFEREIVGSLVGVMSVLPVIVGKEERIQRIDTNTNRDTNTNTNSDTI